MPLNLPQITQAINIDEQALYVVIDIKNSSEGQFLLEALSPYREHTLNKEFRLSSNGKKFLTSEQRPSGSRIRNQIFLSFEEANQKN